jgi:hypothetical protein
VLVQFAYTLSYIFAILAVLPAVLSSIILCGGALIAQEYTCEYRDVFYTADTVNRTSGDYKEALQSADEILEIYDEAESKSLGAIVLWGLVVFLISFFTLLVALFGLLFEWADNEGLVEWVPTIGENTSAGALIIVLLIFVIPLFIYYLYIVHLWGEVRDSDSWIYIRRKLSDEYERFTIFSN